MGNKVSSENSDIVVAGECFINNLPNEILIKIFDILPLSEFSIISSTCRRWNELMCCDIFKSRLKRYYKVLVIDEVNEELPPCKWEPSEIMCNSPIVSWRVMYKMREYPMTSLIPQEFLSQMNSSNRPIRIVLFGLGMESPTCSSRLVPHLLCGHNSTFRTRGMVSGGGIKITYRGKHLLHVMTIYTNTKSVREAIVRNSDVNLFTKWLRPTDGGDQEPSEPGSVKTSRLQSSLRDMIRTTDAFVYVLDSNKSESEERDEMWLHKNQECLQLILDEAVLSEDPVLKRPLLTLSCQNQDQAVYSCLDITRRLQLQRIDRPWNVCNLDLNSLREIENGFNWLIYHTLLQWSNTAKSEEGTETMITEPQEVY